MQKSSKWVSLLVTLLLALVAVACGGGQSGVEHANVKPGDMPEGAEWTGVYYSQTYGNLHLVEQGGTISGKWRTTAGDAWGELAGEANGDLLRYEWTEHRIGMVGPSAATKGRGYFKYVGSENGINPDEIKGEWGLGNKEAGNSWEAVKQRNQKPDPASVVPDEVERRGVGGDWDDDGEKGPTEADKAFGTDRSADDADEAEEEEEDDSPPPSTGPNSDY